MKYLFLSLLAGLLAVSARANDTAKVKKSPEQRAAKQADKMKADLALSDGQRTEVYEACLKRIQDAGAVKAKYADMKGKQDSKTRRSDMKAVQATFDARMKEVLTADQYAKWSKQKEERKSKMKSKRKTQKTP